MYELIDKVKKNWTTFYDWIEFQDWKDLYGAGKTKSIVIVRFQSKDISLAFLQEFLMNRDYFWHGRYLVLEYECPVIYQIVFDLKYNLRLLDVSINDQDIMFYSNLALNNIRKKSDILKVGRLILLEKEDRYSYTKIDDPDEKEFACLLYASSNISFGFEGIKRIIDIIEYKRCYDALYIVISNGLKTCYPCFDYILSYLWFLSECRDYINIDLLRLLIIDSRFKLETARVDKVINTFPKHLSISDRELDIADVRWKTRNYLKDLVD